MSRQLSLNIGKARTNFFGYAERSSRIIVYCISDSVFSRNSDLCSVGISGFSATDSLTFHSVGNLLGERRARRAEATSKTARVMALMVAIPTR